MTPFSATFLINSTIQITPGVETYDVTGEVFDGGGIADGTSFVAGDVVFDSSAFGSYRWKILSVTTPSASAPTYRVAYDDEGSPPFTDVGPAAGAGAVCATATTGLFKVAQIPPLSLNEVFGFTEVLYTAIQNSNDRGTDIEAATLGGGGGTDTNGDFFPEFRVVTAGEATAKQLTLNNMPINPTEVLVDVINGGPQERDVDFSITGNVFSWSGLGLDGVLASGDRIRLVYFK